MAKQSEQRKEKNRNNLHQKIVKITLLPKRSRRADGRIFRIIQLTTKNGLTVRNIYVFFCLTVKPIISCAKKYYLKCKNITNVILVYGKPSTNVIAPKKPHEN